MVGTVDKVTAPEVIVRLLKLIADEPLMVAAPAVVTVPVPPVNVPLLVNVPLAAMFKAPPEVMMMEPALLMVVLTVKAPDAPKLTLFPLVMVKLLGEAATVPLMVIALTTVTADDAVGIPLPNQVEAVFQSVALLDTNPRKVNEAEALDDNNVLVTTTVPVAAAFATVAVMMVSLATLKLLAATPPMVTDIPALLVKEVPLIVMVWPA